MTPLVANKRCHDGEGEGATDSLAQSGADDLEKGRQRLRVVWRCEIAGDAQRFFQRSCPSKTGDGYSSVIVKLLRQRYSNRRVKVDFMWWQRDV
eukprot:COSAG02_NODE_16630_length_1068_cov_10.720651_1_plen_94_part_00